MDHGEGEVQIRVVPQRDLFGCHGAAWPVEVPALVVADGALVRRALRDGTLWAGHLRVPAETEAAAADVERAGAGLGPFDAPTGVALGLPVTLQRAHGRGAEVGPAAADACAGDRVKRSIVAQLARLGC